MTICCSLPNLLAYEVLSIAASWIAATARATLEAVTTLDDGFCHRTSRRRKWQRCRPRCRRPHDEDDAFCTLSHDDHSQKNCKAVHLNRCLPAQPPHSDHQRPQPQVHFQVLARNLGTSLPFV
ncbi:hypothetical protein CLOM_g15536 [Closterium sp. NIES-68]|nr:hypothetical protein CLOM_g15536 [Closterium sp. NIES-68]